MVKLYSSLTALLLCWLVSGTLIAQQQSASSGTLDTSRPEVTPTYVIGEVVERADKQIKLKVEASIFTVLLDQKTRYLRLKPGETKLANAEASTLEEVSVGDRVMALGPVAAEQKSVPARHIIVMKKEELAQKRQREREEWRLRGVAGRISDINAQTKELTVQTRMPGGERPLILKVTDKVALRRYTPDTVKFNDAKPSAFDDLKVGDQIRALGDKSADGTHFTPEQVVSGSFRLIGGRVISVNASGNEVVVRNIQTERPVTILVKEGSMLRRMKPEDVPVLLQRRPAGDNPQGGGGGARRADAQDPIERLPLTTLSDLKEGEMVLVLSTMGANPARAAAIILLAGAEALINEAQKGQQQRPGNNRGPNLSLGLPSGVFDGIISP